MALQSETRTTPGSSSSRGEATRAALVEAAMRVFARDGFDAASTRALSQAAGVNQALIGYHFGSKEGLYRAVFDHIAERLMERVRPLADALEKSLDAGPDCRTERERRARFLPPLMAVCDGMLSLMLSDETQQWSQLIVREQQNPTAAFERLYEVFMGRMLTLMTRMVQRLRDDPDPADARVIVVGILGQVLVWRVARAGILRHLAWSSLGELEIAQARAAVRRSVVAQALARDPT